MPIQFTRIAADAEGQSHFVDGEIELSDKVIGPLIPPLGSSSPAVADSFYLLTFPPGMVIDWHPAPRRLYHFFLAGQCEVAVSDGAQRTFSKGDIVLAEDTTGIGHTTANRGSVDTLMAVVALAD